MNNLPLPIPPAVALPGPAWLFQGLLLLTFVVHLVMMNLVLGGSFITAVHLLRGRAHPDEKDLALTLAKTLPIAMAMAITFGVAPLLFIQVLYGQLFYTSSILGAWPWLTLLVLLVLGYSSFYALSMKGVDLTRAAPYIAAGSAAMIFLVGMIFTSNLTLMQSPGRFHQVYNSGGLGTYLNFGESTMLPRLLHTFLAALATTGVFLALRHGDEPKKRRIGLGWFLAATLLQVAVGLWFLRSHPEDKASAVVNSSVLGLPYFWVSLGAAAVMLLLLAAAFLVPRRRLLAQLGGGFLVLTIALMAGLRTILRNACLEPVFRVDPRTDPQWGPFVMFALVLVAGLAAVGWMILAYRKSLKVRPD